LDDAGDEWPDEFFYFFAGHLVACSGAPVAEQPSNSFAQCLYALRHCSLLVRKSPARDAVDFRALCKISLTGFGRKRPMPVHRLRRAKPLFLSTLHGHILRSREIPCGSPKSEFVLPMPVE
jgi:hypothetical protein